MAIADEDLERVRSAIDIGELIAETVGLRRVGHRLVGLCPFHAEKTPSFSVNAQLGFYNCFGCGAKGDAITWLRETQQLSFVEAVQDLARRVGVVIQEDDRPGGGAAQKRKALLLEVLQDAVDWYHQRLLKHPDAGAARGYLREERGYDGDVVRSYGIGWAPDAWDALVRALARPHDVLRDAGLAYVEGSKASDFFRARVLFPIYDHTGAPVAIGGRQMPGGREPKYKNSTETTLYRKSEVLYGLNWAKQSIVKDQVVVLCEGYTDVIAFHRAGVPNAVATCGTAITEDHVRRLVKFSAQRVVLGYDADAAGQAAVAKFQAWEAKYKLDVRVAALPPGSDPADVARRNPDALRRAVDDSRPIIEFRLRRFLAAADRSTNEGRARAAQGAMAIVNEHPDVLVRDQYLQQVADETRLSPERLRQLPKAPPASEPTDEPAPRRRPVSDRLHPAEAAALWWALNEPEAWLAAAAALEVAPEDLERLVALFNNETAAEAYRLLCTAADLVDAVGRADEQVAETVTELATAAAPSEQPFDVVVELAVKHATYRRRRIQAAQRREGIERAELAQLVGEDRALHGLLEAANELNGRRATGPGLVAWLLARDDEGGQTTG